MENRRPIRSSACRDNCELDTVWDDIIPNTFEQSDEGRLLQPAVTRLDVHRHNMELVDEDAPRRHLCGFVDSCFGRCGSGPLDKDSIFSYLNSGHGPSALATTFTCFCDMQCSTFGDCCRDFSRYCGFGIASEDPTHKSNIKTELALVSDEHHTNATQVTDNGGGENAGFSVDDIKGIEPPNKCAHVDQVESGSIWIRTECHADWEDANIAVLCYNIDYRDDIAVLLVQDEYGITYRNIFCAQCNFVKAFWFWILDSYCYGEFPSSILGRPDLLPPYLNTQCLTRFRVPFGQMFRPCLEVVGTCPNQEQRDPDYEINAYKCRSGHESLVTFDSISSKITGSRIFKNEFCAECSGIQPSNISCPTKELLQGHYLPNAIHTDELLEKIISRGGTETVTHRIVTNYNIRGTMTATVVYRDDGYLVPIVYTCEEGMVFDPYLGACRQLHCSDGYILLHDECVPSKATDELSDDEVMEIQEVLISAINETIGLDDELVVTIQVILDFDTPDKKKSGNNPRIPANPSSDDLLVSNGTNWKIYFSSLSQNTTNPDNTDDKLYELTITMVFEDTSMFPYIKDQFSQLVRNLADLNSANEINIYVNDVCIVSHDEDNWLPSEVINGNVTDLNYLINRCENGNVTVILSNDFVMYTGNSSAHEASCPVIYVNSTSKVYDCADNYIFGYDPTASSSEQHYGAVVCDVTSPLDPSCELLLLNETECDIFPNGTMITDSGVVYSPGEYYITPEGIEVCNVYSNVISEFTVIFFNFSDPQTILLCVGLVISTLCVSACAITYIMFGELRKLPGINRMSLMVTSIGGNVAMLVGLALTPGSIGCQVIAIMTHYFFLTRVFWTNAILIHAFQTFGPKFEGSFARRVVRYNSSYSQFRQHAPYALYAWGVPLLLVTLGTVLHFCECGPLAVYYGSYMSCFIADPKTFTYLFCIPLAAILIFNIFLYIPTVYSIQISSKSSPRRVTKKNKNQHLSIYAKLSTTAGFCWLFGIIAAFSHLDGMWYLFIVFLSLEGLFIFFAFFCTRRVKNLYSRRFSQNSNLSYPSKLGVAKSRGVYSISDKVDKKSAGESNETFQQMDV